MADEFLEVVHRLQRLVVARQADHADLGVGHHVENALQHAQSGAQDRHDRDLAARDLVDLDRAAPAFDAGLFQRKVGRGLVGQQPRQLMREFAKLLRRHLVLAQ